MYGPAARSQGAHLLLLHLHHRPTSRTLLFRGREKNLTARRVRIQPRTAYLLEPESGKRLDRARCLRRGVDDPASQFSIRKPSSVGTSATVDQRMCFEGARDQRLHMPNRKCELRLNINDDDEAISGKLNQRSQRLKAQLVSEVGRPAGEMLVLVGCFE